MNVAVPNIAAGAPEISIFAMACVILIVDLFLDDSSRYVGFLLTLGTLAGTAVLIVHGFHHAPVYAFHHMFVADALSDTLDLAICGLGFFVLAYSRRYLKERGIFQGEYFVLALFGIGGMMVMTSAAHFLVLYLGLELMALSQYAMVALQRDSSRATEASMKYFVLGALASGMLLYGMSMLYGVTGSLDIETVRQKIAMIPAGNVVLIFGLVFIVVGLAFKLGAVPFHMWIPDVYDGAPTAVTLYVATMPKIAAFAIIMRLLVGGLQGLAGSWHEMLMIMAVLSMAIGNVIAIAQTNIKRMLAYSAISHMGFFLLGIISAGPEGYGAAMFYMLVYASMSLGAFGMVIVMSRAGFEADNLDDFKGLNQRSPWHAFMMLLFMFSMAGIPPTAGFYAKLLVFQAIVNAGYVWLAAVGVLLSVVGAFYYLRVIKLMYFDAPADTSKLKIDADLRLMIAVNGIAMIAITPWVGALVSLCSRAIHSMS